MNKVSIVFSLSFCHQHSNKNSCQKNAKLRRWWRRAQSGNENEKQKRNDYKRKIINDDSANKLTINSARFSRAFMMYGGICGECRASSRPFIRGISSTTSCDSLPNSSSHMEMKEMLNSWPAKGRYA